MIIKQATPEQIVEFLMGIGTRGKTMTTKLDGKFYGDIFKAKDNSKVPDDEYVVFLAKDNAFAAMLPLYHAECMRLGADVEQMVAVERLIERVDAWREANPDKCKTPDAAGERMLDSEMTK